MKILILSEKHKQLFNESEKTLLHHAEEWSKLDNEIYILSSDLKSKKHKSFLNFIEKPKFLVNNLLLSVWFSVVNHPPFDLVIKNISLIPFYYKKSEILILYSEHNRLPATIKTFLVRNIYKNSHFLITNVNLMDSLLKNNVKRENIYLLQNAFDINSIPSQKKVFNKKIAYIHETNNKLDLSEAIEVFKEIERRDEGWKYSLLCEANEIKSLKELISKTEINPKSLSLINKTALNIKNTLLNNNIIIDLSADESSFQTDLYALALNNVVISFKTKYISNNLNFEKSILTSESNNSHLIAKIAIEYAKNPIQTERQRQNIQNFLSQFGWKKLAENSFKFLESV